MHVYVNYEDTRWRKYKINFEKIVNAVVGLKYKDAEVSITLVDDKHIKKLNKKYRGINNPTNVLSFELSDDVLLGDIFISIDTVQREAHEENISVAEHTAHMVVHGLLHLLGYDHIKDADAKKMENKEIAILKKLGYKNPYTAKSGVCNDKTCCPGGRTISAIKRFFSCAFGRSLLYVLCAVLTAAGFAPFNMWWATVIGVSGAYILSIKYLTGYGCWRRFWRIFPFGAGYAIAMFWWVLHSIYVVPELADQFAIWTVPALIGIGIVGGLIFCWPFLAISSSRINPGARPFLFAGIWTLVLWLREWLFTGFPWNPIANISFANIFVANSMSLYGALGLTFVIVGMIAALSEIIHNRYRGLNWVSLFIFIGLFIIGIGYGVKNVHIANDESVAKTPIIRIVQPAQSAVQKATHSHQAMVQNAQYNLRALTRLGLMDGEYDLIVFPETAYPFVLTSGDILYMAQVLSRPTIIGSNYYSDGNLFNSLVVANEYGAITNVYSKSHLVPFGEYRPFGNIIPTPGQLTPGNGPEIISVNVNSSEFTFVPAVCYEIIFSDSLLPNGDTPDAIINITNDNWFGKTPGTYQHLDMVRRYAIESGLPIVRANYSGISALVSSDGSIISEMPIGQTGVIDGYVWGAHKTIYRQFGRNLWMIIILFVACVGAMWMSLMSRKNR